MTRNPYLLLLMMVVIVAGCATGTDRRVITLYQPAAPAAGGTGELYLAQEAQPLSKGEHPVQWILGEVLDGEGRKTGRVVSDISPEDTVLDAFRHELAAAGYQVQTVNSLPSGSVKGLRLMNATMALDVTPGWSHDQAECRILVAVEPWVNGSAVSRVTYQARYADAAVVGRPSLPATVTKKALQTLMKRAVPEIVAILEHAGHQIR